MINLKEILYDYAYTKGGGLPLTPQEMCNAVVQWVQKYRVDEKIGVELTNEDSFVSISKSTNDNGNVIYNINLDIARLVHELDNQFTADNFLNAFTLNQKIVGSDSVVVDISEDNKKLVIKLDQTLSDTINKLDNKAILKPDSLTAESVPVVGTAGEVSYKPVSELGGAIYYHQITIGSNIGFIYFSFYSTNRESINAFSKLKTAKYLGICNFYTQGRGFGELDVNTTTNVIYFVGYAGDTNISKVSESITQITSVSDNVIEF